jgi:hypothetical protein
MGYGLQGAFGLDAAQQGLRQRLMDQMLVERHKQEMEMQQRQQALREQEVSQRTGGMGGQLYTPPTMGQSESGEPFDPALENPAMNLGTAQQQATGTKNRILGRLIEGLPSDSNERKALEYQQATGDNPPAGMFKGAATTKPVMRINRATGKMEQIGDAPADSHFVNEPQPPPPIVIQTGTGFQTVDRGSGTATPITSGGQPVGLPPTGAQRGQQSDNEAVLTGITRIRELAPSFEQLDKLVGPALGRYNQVNMNIPGTKVDPEVAEFYAEVAALKNRMITAITGAAMGVQETNRIMNELPDVTQKPEVFIKRMAATERNRQAVNNAIAQKNGPNSSIPPVKTGETPEQRRARIRKAAGL